MPKIPVVKVREHTLEQVRQRILRLCNTGLDSRTLQREVMAALRRAVPCDAWCIGTIDPATLMITSSIGEGYPMKGSGRFLELEYGEAGVNKYAELAEAHPAGRSARRRDARRLGVRAPTGARSADRQGSTTNYGPRS